MSDLDDIIAWFLEEHLKEHPDATEQELVPLVQEAFARLSREELYAFGVSLVTREIRIRRAMKGVEDAAAALKAATGASTVREAEELVAAVDVASFRLHSATMSSPAEVRHAEAAETFRGIAELLRAAADFHRACADLIEATGVETMGEAVEEAERMSPDWVESWAR